MGEKNKKQNAEPVVKEIKRHTRREFTAEKKIKIVLEGMRGEDSIAAICRKHAIHVNNYFKWNKEFIEVGKRRLSGDTLREATHDIITFKYIICSAAPFAFFQFGVFPARFPKMPI